MADVEKKSNADKLKDITDKLETGIKEVFESEKYKEYLSVMSKFYNYSFNNTMLIAMQRPDATLVAGYKAWEQKFGRHVNKGATAIRILVPATYKKKQEMEKIDPKTQKPILDVYGKPVTEEVKVILPYFRPGYVFDVSQTSGKELPTFGVDELKGDVEGYRNFFEVLKEVSPVPIKFDRIEGRAKGFYSLVTKDITIREGMSQLQNVKTAIHEMAHAKLHDVDIDKHGKPKNKAVVIKDKNTEEVEAESIAFVVCQRYGIDTSEYSFKYLAKWSSDKDLPQLKASLKTISDTAAEFIEQIDEKLKNRELENNKNIEAEHDFDVENDVLVPVYQQSAQYAYQHNESDAWRRSHRINEECADYINSNADVAHNEHRMSEFSNALVEKFGHERAMYVIARNIQAREGDGRFDKAVAERAAAIDIPDMKLEYDNTTSYLVNTHSVVLNFVFRDLMDIEKELTRMPDNTTPEQMHNYGYTSDIMIPMESEAAKEYFDKGLSVYALYEDNTESMITSHEEIDEHKGLFGVEAEEWTAYLDSERHASMVEEQQSNKEAAFIFGPNDGFAVYQLRDDAPREYQFERLRGIGGSDMVDKSNYQFIYSDDLETDQLDDTYGVLGNIYEEFNMFKPDDFKGHSLSVSDIVVLKRDGELTSFYVDSFSFEEIPHFYGDNPKDLIWDNEKQTYLAKAKEQLAQQPELEDNISPSEIKELRGDTIPQQPIALEDMVSSGNATLRSKQLERKQAAHNEPKKAVTAKKASLVKRVQNNQKKISTTKSVPTQQKSKNKELGV